MTEPLNEQLSAFIDGELPRSESELFMRQVPRDAELRAAASRYYLIGQAIRAEPSPVRRGFSRRVAAAVANTIQDAGIAGSVTAMARELPRPRMAGWWKPIAGVAVAAGVAIVAIFIVQGQQGSRDLPATVKNDPVPTVTPAAPQPQAESRSNPAAGSGEEPSYVVPRNALNPDPGLARAQLASYVFAHSEYSTLTGRRNVVSDAANADETTSSTEARKP